MASAWSQLEQMLTCAICLDKFKNPRLLPCQHSFCGDACMDGLVDYARRQIKCPECRAEHRIPYQGVSSLPSNVTLIRFLELHSRITGEEPEPVPTFMEKCSVCGEKVDGVQRCSHCDKKVCPECKEAHIDLLRREINRINGQSKRCLSKIQEFKDVLDRSQERLIINHKSVKREIEESCRRLIEDLQSKQKRFVEEVDSFAEQEQKTIDKLKIAIIDELKTLDSNSKLADEKVTNKYQWTDQELSEMKEIYAKAMEFVRLFDPEIGDFTRKMRFTLIPEFETLRRRICELGELKFGESADSLMANALQHCNATGNVAMELCNSAAAQAAAMAANASSSVGGYGLSHSSSNSQLGGGPGQSTMLELPSMQNSLMRSQSDHRLASQFQQRLKQQQLLEANKNGAFTSSSSGSRYGASSTARDYDTESSMRSRYAPRGSTGSGKDYNTDLLTRDWPRPSDNDEVSFGSSIQFKSAFMRRKEKERQQTSGGFSSTYNNEDDDDLTSEASYGGHSTGGRNVRFNDPSSENQLIGRQPLAKLFDCKEAEHGPLSGVPRLESSAHLLARLHQMGAKAVVDKKNAEEEGRRDKDLVESARQAMSKASERKLTQRQMSEDEVEKQKKANKQQQTAAPVTSSGSVATTTTTTQSTVSRERTGTITGNDDRASSAQSGGSARSATSSQQYSRLTDNSLESNSRHSPTPTADLTSSASTVVEMEPSASASLPGTPPSAAAAAAASPATNAAGGRRNLYGQAVTEKSKRQLSNAMQDAASYSRRRAAAAASTSIEGEQTPEASSASSSTTTTTTTTTTTPSRVKRTLRSTGRSMSKQSSIDQSIDGASGGNNSTGTGQRRRRNLVRAESSQQSLDSPSTASGSGSGLRQISASSSASIGPSAAPTTFTPETESKNFATGSGGHSDNSQSSHQGSLTAAREVDRRSGYNRARSTIEQTSTTTDDDVDMDNLEEAQNSSSRRTPTRPKLADYSAERYSSSLKRRSSKDRATSFRSSKTLSDDDDDGDGDGDEDDDDDQDKDKSDDRNNVDDDDDDNDDDDDDDDDDGDQNDGYNKSRSAGNRRSREMLPNAVNKLLDRSAQIRRDSQEQRSRGDSPQRTTQPARSYYSSRAGATTGSGGGGAASGYSSSPGSSSAMSSATRQRLAYQRSQSNRDSQHQDDDTTNSNNSIYTTASSGSQIASSGRRSSAEADEFNSTSATTRRSSGHSSDRTLISDHSRPSYHRRDSSGDSNAPIYQSRFLSRSRTSAALSGGAGGTSSSSNRSHESSEHLPDSSTIGDRSMDGSSPHSAARSYLSSRDRFMQSASLMSSSSSPTHTTTTGSSPSGSSNLYSRSGSSAGKFTNLLAWRSMLRARFNFPHH